MICLEADARLDPRSTGSRDPELVSSTILNASEDLTFWQPAVLTVSQFKAAPSYSAAPGSFGRSTTSP
jgi:hypothetical protein